MNERDLSLIKALGEEFGAAIQKLADDFQQALEKTASNLEKQLEELRRSIPEVQPVEIPDVSKMVSEAVSAIELPKAPELPDLSQSIADAAQSAVKQALESLPKPKDGKSVSAEDLRSLVGKVVSASLPEPVDVEKLAEDVAANIPVPEPGSDGKDALSIELEPFIDEKKSYPRGTYATHNGGLWRSHEKTHGMRGWECIVDGVSNVDIKQDNQRTFSISLERASGAVEVKSFDVPVEVRARRTNEQGQDNSRDQMFWQSLRGRLLVRPTSYSGVTTMAVTVETGGKLAAQSDRRVNVVATRIYDEGLSRSISGALYHIGDELGLAMDHEAIDYLESAYWTPNSEFFDYATTDSVSALEMFQKVTNAGKSYFFLSDGMASVAREGVKTWTGIISPQETTEALQTAFIAPSDDDYDGVDVTYINGTTWAEETVQCRTPDNPTPLKIEDYTLDGVLDQDRAYQIGMRRLMKYRQQRLTHTTTTEMDALCYNVGDRIIFTDDIPGSKTISALIDDVSASGGVTTFTVSEHLDWTFNNPRALIRYQDGSASGLLLVTKVSDYELSVAEQADFNSIVLNDPSIEPPRLIFCESSRVGYSALISEIAPQSDGTCQVTAKEYRDSFYQYDNASYPGNVA